MKCIKQCLLTITIIAALAGASWGTPVTNTSEFLDDKTTLYGYYANSGSLMFDVSGNNEGNFFESVKDLVDTWLTNKGYNEINFLKTSATITVTGADNNGNTIPVANALTGLWNVTDPSDGTINFYAVKAGNGYAMYLVNPAANDGSWSTYDLWKTGLYNKGDSLEISHLTGYTGDPGDPVNPVPEPATMLLFGIGLVGLAAVNKNKLSKQK